MSHCEEITITCPACHAEQRWTMWHVLDAQSNPDLKHLVLARELTRFTCANCGEHLPVQHPLLYLDSQLRLALWLNPDPAGPPQPPESDLPANMHGYIRRRVSRLNDLIDKILIFEEALDDRVIELCKAALRQRPENQNAGPEAQMLFAGATPGENGEPILQFIFLTSAGGRPIPVPQKQLYTSLRTRYASALAGIGQGWLRIDEDYARSILR